MAFNNRRDTTYVLTGSALAAHLVLNEPLTGAVDGINATFVTSADVTGTSIEVFIGTILQGSGGDYTFTGPRTVVFNNPPQPGDYPTADYIK